METHGLDFSHDLNAVRVGKKNIEKDDRRQRPPARKTRDQLSTIFQILDAVPFCPKQRRQIVSKVLIIVDNQYRCPVHGATVCTLMPFVLLKEF